MSVATVSVATVEMRCMSVQPTPSSVGTRVSPSSPSPSSPPSHEVSSEPSSVSKVAMHAAGGG